MCLRNWRKKRLRWRPYTRIRLVEKGEEMSVCGLFEYTHIYKFIFSLHLMCTVWCSNCIKISWFHGHHHQRHHHYHAILCISLSLSLSLMPCRGVYPRCIVWRSLQPFHFDKRPVDRQNWNFACLLTSSKWIRACEWILKNLYTQLFVSVILAVKLCIQQVRMAKILSGKKNK